MLAFRSTAEYAGSSIVGTPPLADFAPNWLQRLSIQRITPWLSEVREPVKGVVGDMITERIDQLIAC